MAATLAFIGLGIFMLAMATPAITAKPNLSHSELGIWSEFLDYSKVRNFLPSLKEHHLSLSLAISADHPNFDEFAKVYIEAEEMGVEVRPWLLLTEKDGYWFNKWNFPQAKSFVDLFVSEMKQRNIKLQWLVFDVEPPRSLIEEAQKLLQEGHYLTALHLLQHSSQDASLAAAERAYAQLVDDLHQQGVHVQGVISNFVLNDLQDSHRRIQSALGTPVFGIAWDEISFMVYRVEFQRVLGPVGPWIVYEYAKRAHSFFGSRAGLDIGEAGHVSYPAPFSGYTDPQDLKDDLAAVSAAGLEKIHIYSLDGISERGIHFWLGSLEAKSLGIRDLESFALMFLFDQGRLLLPEAH